MSLPAPRSTVIAPVTAASVTTSSPAPVETERIPGSVTIVSSPAPVVIAVKPETEVKPVASPVVWSKLMSSLSPE